MLLWLIIYKEGNEMTKKKKACKQQSIFTILRKVYTIVKCDVLKISHAIINEKSMAQLKFLSCLVVPIMFAGCAGVSKVRYSTLLDVNRHAKQNDSC